MDVAVPGCLSQRGHEFAERGDAMAGEAQLADDAGVSYVDRGVGAGTTRGGACRGEQTFGFPVTQRGGADAESAGELGDGHRVVGAGVMDRFGGDRGDRVLGEDDVASFGVQSCVRGVENGEQSGSEDWWAVRRIVLASMGPTPAVRAV